MVALAGVASRHLASEWISLAGLVATAAATVWLIAALVRKPRNPGENLHFWWRFVRDGFWGLSQRHQIVMRTRRCMSIALRPNASSQATRFVAAALTRSAAGACGSCRTRKYVSPSVRFCRQSVAHA